MRDRGRKRRFQAEATARWPSGAHVEHHPAGEQSETFHPGDVSLHRATATKGGAEAITALGKLIHARERPRAGSSDFARWTHSAWIVSEDGYVCEALEKGLVRDSIGKSDEEGRRNGSPARFDGADFWPEVGLTPRIRRASRINDREDGWRKACQNGG
jgi:hypothetical protein